MDIPCTFLLQNVRPSFDLHSKVYKWATLKHEQIKLMYLLHLPPWLAPIYPHVSLSGRAIIVGEKQAVRWTLDAKVMARQVDDCPCASSVGHANDADVKPNAITLLSYNVLSLRDPGRMEIFAGIVAGKNVAVAGLMEARMKEEGIESFKAPGSDNDVTVISSAASKMGGLGCAIVINEEIPWRFDDEKPRYLKGESCSIVVAWPRFLLASCNDEVYKGYFVVVHIPQRNCKEMDASLFVSNVVRKIKKQVKDNANMMFFLSMPMQLDVE